MQKGFAPIVILVVLTVVALGGFYYYQLKNITSYDECKKFPGSKELLSYPPICQTLDNRSFPRALSLEEQERLKPPQEESDETSNWKTYTQKSLGYSIAYPALWNVYSLEDYPYEGYPGVIDPNSVIVTTSTKFPEITAGSDNPKTYFGYQIGGTLEDINTLIKKLKGESVDINGMKVFKESQNDGDIAWYIPYPSNKTGGIIISVLSSSASQDRKGEIEKSISTFKFLK